MNDQRISAPQEKERPSCNVNQTFNFSIGAVAVLVAAIVIYLLLR